MMIKRGEKVAFVGKNGEGKSTLVKCIMGEIDYEGTLKVGHNTQIGYFAQNQAQLLDENLTVFETIDNVAKGEIRLKIKDILGAFMFGGEASDKYVKVLSGGERSRLAMIRLLLEPVNFLILDEPTNHLDMQSKDVLKEAIRAFDGTAIIVSHDRDFLDGLVDKVYEFGGGKVREHLGGIYEYLRFHNAETIEEAQTLSPLPLKGGEPESAKKSPFKGDLEGRDNALSYAERKEQQKKINKIQKQIKACEEKIATLEAKLDELGKKLEDPANASDMKLVNQYTETQEALDKEMETWEELSLLIEN